MGAPPQSNEVTARLEGSVSAVAALQFAWANFRFMDMLLALVFGFIPIAGPIALIGWHAETHQRLLRSHPNPVPKLDFADFGHYLERGVPAFLSTFLMSLPISPIIVGIVYAGIAITVILSVALAALLGTIEPALGAIGFVVGITVGILLQIATVMLLASVLGAVLNSVVIRAEVAEDFGEAFNISAVRDMVKRNWAVVLVSNLAFGVMAVGLVFCGMLACYFGIFPVAAVLQNAACHLRFQQHLAYRQKGGAPLPMRPARQLPSEGMVRG